MKIDKNNSEVEKLIAEFDERSLRCSICNSERIKIKLKDIPIKVFKL